MDSVTDDWVEKEVRPRMETHFESFMPGFKDRFKYSGFLINTATKLRTATEFRHSLVWRKGRVIQQLSGKLTNCISAAESTCELIAEEELGVNLSGVSEQYSKELRSASVGMGSTCDMGVHRWN